MVDITHYSNTYIGFESEDLNSHWIGTWDLRGNPTELFIDTFSETSVAYLNGQFAKGAYSVHVIVNDQQIPCELVVIHSNAVGDGTWNNSDRIQSDHGVMAITQTEQRELSDVKQVIDVSPYKSAVQSSSSVVAKTGYGNGTYDLYTYKEDDHANDVYLGIRSVFINEDEYF